MNSGNKGVMKTHWIFESSCDYGRWMPLIDPNYKPRAQK
jgi:hypothetical protein